MGAACKKSKVKDPKREAARELEEKEKREKEAQKNAEEEAAKAAEEKRLEEEEEAAEKARLEEEEKRRAEEEAEEARRKAAAEEEEAARLKALEEEEAERLKKEQEEAERKAREEAEAAERAAIEVKEAEVAPTPPPAVSVPEPTQLDQDEMTPHEKYQKLASDQDMDAASEATLSTQATGAVQRPQESIKETKPSPPPQQVKVTAAPMSARSVTPCDMTAVDQTAKLVSKSCGCDMGDNHDENKCPICKNMDLSDAPLLN